MAVPNFSTAQVSAVAELAAVCAEAGASVLDVHSDRDHGRTVFTLAAPPPVLVDALVALAEACLVHIDVGAGPGQHPRVGALDVVPVVHLDDAQRGPACAAALVVGDRIASQLALPVLLYGELSYGSRTRAGLRRGGVAGLSSRLASGELTPDFGPVEPHPTGGATLLAARPVLVAFNLQLAPPATLDDARRVAAAVREGGERGMSGLRAIAVELSGGVAQVSMNIERPGDLPVARVVEAVRDLAAVSSGELVGLAPRAALAGMPADLPLPGFDPARQVIENALGSS